MVIIFALLCGVLLVAISTAQDGNSGESEPISFDNFCTHFDELRSTRSMNNVLRDLESIREQLLANGVVPERGAVDAVEEVCRDPSKFFDTECLFRNRFLMTIPNSDLIRLHDLTLRGFYVDLFLLHPVFRSCLPTLNKDVKSNDVKARLAKGLAGERPQDFAALFDKRNGKFLRKEIKKLCEEKNGDEIFCASLPDIVKLVDTFERVKRESRTGVKWNAYRLHFVMLKYNNPDEFQQVYPTTTQELNDLLVKNLDEIFKYVGQGQFAEFSEMMSFVPDLETIKSGCKTSWDLPSNTKKNACMFWKAIIQVSAYIQSTKPPASGQVKKMLNTHIDYPTFLRLTEMDRILQVVQNQETAITELVEWLNRELTKTVNERFKGLRTYFEKVESFNRDKAGADIGYINGRLSKYTNNINSLSTTLGGKLNKIIELAIAAVSLEIAEDTIQVGLAAAVLMNPLEKLFGGSSAGDFIDRSAKLASTLTRVGELVRMSKTFNELKDKTISISDRFKENSEFLENIRVLITSEGQDKSTTDFETRKQTFLTDYGCYDPKVEKPELTGMTTTWENLVDAACDVITDQSTALAQTTVAWVRSSGICSKTKVLAQEMIATYEEIYDFQFELVEAMATYMRAETSLDAAASITAGYEESATQGEPDESVVNDLKILTMVSFISYKTNIWQITEAYCDVLEYKEGGVRPSVCQGVNTNIASLVAHVSPTCRNVEEYQDVPTTSESDQGFMNMADLYSGKRVIFKIPNGQWLVDKGWISQQDKEAAIFVKKFEVYVPTVSVTERRVRVQAAITGMNKLTLPDGKSYVIVPERNFIFEYLEGHGAQPCRKESEALSNPYGADLPKICPVNVDENNCQELLEKTPLFPSVYSQWKVSLLGYEAATVPDPATVLNLKVGMRLCILNRGSSQTKKTKVKKVKNAAKKKHRDRTSCPDGQYWAAGSGSCTTCPKGSKSALDGYYCEKIRKKV